MENKLLKNENRKRVTLSSEWIKKFSTETLLMIFIISLMLFFAPAYAGEQNWVYLGEIGDDLWLVDTDSITCRENICTAWVKILPRASVKKLSIKKEEYTKSLHEYNCSWMEYRILHTTKYDSDGNATRSVPITELGKKQIVPESISKELYDLVCKRTSLKKEQQNIYKKYPEEVAEEAQKNAIEKGEAERIGESTKQLQTQAPVPPKKAVSPRKTEKDRKKQKRNLHDFRNLKRSYLQFR